MIGVMTVMMLEWLYFQIPSVVPHSLSQDLKCDLQRQLSKKFYFQLIHLQQAEKQSPPERCEYLNSRSYKYFCLVWHFDYTVKLKKLGKSVWVSCIYPIYPLEKGAQTGDIKGRTISPSDCIRNKAEVEVELASGSCKREQSTFSLGALGEMQ